MVIHRLSQDIAESTLQIVYSYLLHSHDRTFLYLKKLLFIDTERVDAL